MAFLRQYVFPVLIVLTFLVALVAVSARIFLPSDMAAPAPIEEMSGQPQQAAASTSEKVATQLPATPAMGN